jgi:hypothetical protein
MHRSVILSGSGALSAVRALLSEAFKEVLTITASTASNNHPSRSFP